MRNLAISEDQRPVVMPDREPGKVLGVDDSGDLVWVDSASAAALDEIHLNDFSPVSDAVFDEDGVLDEDGVTDNMPQIKLWVAELCKGGGIGVMGAGFYGINTRLTGAGAAVLSPTYHAGVPHGSGDTQPSVIIKGQGGRTVLCPYGDYYPDEVHPDGAVNFNDVFQVNGGWGLVRFQDFTVLGNDADNLVQGPFDCASFVNVIGQSVTVDFEHLQFHGVASLNYVGGGNTASIIKSNALMSRYRNVNFFGCGAPYFGCAILTDGCIDLDNCYFQDYGGFLGHYQGKTSILGPYAFIGVADSSSFGAPGKRTYSIRNARCDEGVVSAVLFSRVAEPYQGLEIVNLQCMPPLSSGGAISISNAERARILGGSIYCRAPNTNPQIVLIDTIAELKQVKMDSTSRTPWTGGPGMVWLEASLGPTPRAHFIDCDVDEIRGQGGVNPADPSQYAITSMGCHSPLKFTDAQIAANLGSDSAVKAFFNVPSAVGIKIYNIDQSQHWSWSGSAWLLDDGSTP